MAIAYPMKDHRLTTRQYRVDATGFATETDARAAIMEHRVSNPADDYSIREYRGEGFFVLIAFPAGGSRWLAYLPVP